MVCVPFGDGSSKIAKIFQKMIRIEFPTKPSCTSLDLLHQRAQRVWEKDAPQCQPALGWVGSGLMAPPGQEPSPRWDFSGGWEVAARRDLMGEGERLGFFQHLRVD